MEPQTPTLPAIGDRRSGSKTEQTATIELEAGRFRLHARVSATPTGLLAIGALVSGILLSSAAIVLASGEVVRRRPWFRR